MKVRNGFVSNSSSSSFVVINTSTAAEYHDEVNTVDTSQPLKVPETFGGETEFGWQIEKYYDIGSKINFAYLQAQFLGDYHIDMVKEVLIEELNVPDVEFNVDGYIDHQSSVLEGSNREIFESELMLKEFIFIKGSYIQNDNDNH